MPTVAVRTARIVDRNGGALDEVSKAIIEQLQQDGRRSYAAVGKVVGLSEAAVRQRVQRLIDGGVMQIVAVTDPLELGFARQAMIGLNVEGELEGIADQLAAMDEVEYVVITAGSFDILAEVVCESDEHLLEVLSTRIRAIPRVKTTESFVYLKLRKQTYSWGVR
jgi:Lrp/AsnC family transcriptional regulator for asnA, asnC and gidA